MVIFQEISNRLDFHFFLDASVNFPRIPGEEDTLDLEPLNCPEVIKALVFCDKTKINHGQEPNIFWGSASFSAIAIRELRGNRRSQGVLGS